MRRANLKSEDGLIPFTRWVTPANRAKRFTTQMYLYMLPLSSASTVSAPGAPTAQQETIIPVPTHDGKLEHTAASFDSASAWLQKCQAGKIILYPPQMYLMSLIAGFMPDTPAPAADPVGHYRSQRESLLEFLQRTPVSRRGAEMEGERHPTADIPWGEKVMSPTVLFTRTKDRRLVLGLDKPGLELKQTGRGGDYEQVVLAWFTDEGPKGLELRWRDEVFAEERAAKQEVAVKETKL